MENRALVTGGLGFIGSNLVDELHMQGWIVDVIDDMSNGHLKFLESEGRNVRTVHINMLPIWENSHEPNRDPNDILVITGDFASDEVLSRVRRGVYNTVFHRAANPRVEYSVKNPTETTEQNILKTVGLFEVAAAGGARVVFSSSSAIYGNVDQLPTSESAQCSPRSPYALQKQVGEQFACLFADLYGLDVACLRYFNVYGPRQYGDSPYSTAISAWCDKIAGGNPLRSDGDGTQSRDMVYVGDVVAANVAAASRKQGFKGDVYNVATGDRYTNNYILNMFEEQFGEICITHAPERPGDVKHTQADVNRSFAELGFKAKVPLKEGLVKTWEWWSLNDNE